MSERKLKMQRVYKVIMLCILTMVITFIATTIFLYQQFQNIYTKEQYATTLKTDEISLIKTLETFKNILELKYMGEINESDLIEGAIKGYVDGIGDPYTQYLTKEEMEAFTEETSSEYVGIGIYVSNLNNQIYVIETMKNSPALEAGIKAGDIITKIDGVEYEGEELTKATSILKGKEGTSVEVTVLRNEKEITLTVIRKKIEVEHVESKMLENNIAYIEIDSFDSKVASSFESQIKDLIAQGAEKLIIDLRSNGGGIVDEATDIADLFIEKGETILITKGKEEEEKTTISKKDPIISNMPVVILVNQATASASEILAGALKDQYGATIVGKNTYGKGVIQTLYTLTDGSGLKITTNEYYTPNHTKINKTGIAPDYEVELTSSTDDTQLKKAIEVIKNK